MKLHFYRYRMTHRRGQSVFVDPAAVILEVAQWVGVPVSKLEDWQAACDDVQGDVVDARREIIDRVVARLFERSGVGEPER